MSKQKIIITGALGYLGTELCKLYSGESRYKDIICIDNRFISERVTQLRKWGMQFVQCDISDTNKLNELLQEANICYHFAGITDVAYTTSDVNSERDGLIHRVGVLGTFNILSVIPSTCKLIFPSTHVVYEGLQETKLDIGEEEFPSPVLVYAKGKVHSESDIRRRTNYIITRLGSVYGYSGDTMRINIMPNLFSKIASQDGTINLFGGGVQYKSLVHVVDVVRAMKFLAESDRVGTYHLSNENLQIKDVAAICKSINPKVQSIETADDVPNQGYTLSNQKLLSTGFKFRYNIQDAIQEMITKWSDHKQPEQLEYFIEGGKEYADSRGHILNYELTEPINLIGYITSLKGTVRANHYHPIQEQKCLLISGRYVSVIKDLSNPEAIVEYKIVHPGDIAVIRPNVAHTMVFLQDSVFLNLVNGEREHENYGITHTIPYELVNESDRQHIMEYFKTECRVCGCKNLERGIDLGMSPLANNLKDEPGPAEKFPLELEYCPECYNMQLSYVVPGSKLFDNYLYVSSTSASFRKHFETLADQIIKEYFPRVVLDIGSNDGVFLKPLVEQGVIAAGIEPAKNLVDLANSKDLPTLHGYFNNETANNFRRTYGQPDVITVFNVFAHADDLKGILSNALDLLSEFGVFIVEVQYIIDTIKDLTFDNIYHEHTNYWSVTTLRHLVYLSGKGKLFKVEHVPTHGGSIRCYISKDDRLLDSSVEEFMRNELQAGLDNKGLIQLFAKRVEHTRQVVRENMKLLTQKFSMIVGYGAPAKATTALNYYGITGENIAYTIEDNTLKNGKWIPGVNIPIWESDDIYKRTEFFPDLVIVLAWNFYENILQKEYIKQMAKDGDVRFISIKDLEVPQMPALDVLRSELVGNKSTGKVYDCFIFYNELDLLELRLNIMDPVVDHFVIVEASTTHKGEPKLWYYQENEQRFDKWKDKIIYIQVDLPDNYEEFAYIDDTAGTEFSFHHWCHNLIMKDITTKGFFKTDNPVHGREQYQRSATIMGLFDAEPDDIIMLSDIDEIGNPDTIQVILNNFDPSRVYALRQNSYYYKLNLLKETHWVGQRIATLAKFNEITPDQYRHVRDIIVEKGGWHFSFQGNSEQVRNKLIQYSHCDLATEEVLEHLDTRVENGIDPFNRGNLIRVDIDHRFPEYVQNNIDQLQNMIA